MQALHDSKLYMLYCLVAGWLSRQWEGSRFVSWLTHQHPAPATGLLSAGSWFRDRLSGLFRRLRIDRLLNGSIFLHPTLFVCAVLLLAPLLPTMVVLALAAGGFFSLFLTLGLRRDMPLTGGPLGAYVVLYAVVYLYATLTSTSVSGSLYAGLLTVGFVLFYFVVTSCGISRKHLRYLLAAMVAAGVVISLYGFYQLMNPSMFRSVWTDTDMFSTITFRVYSTLENPNVLGEYFLLIIPLGAAMLLTADRWPKRIVYLIACGIMCVCLILTYSRGCYLGLLFAVLVFLVLLDRRFLILGIVLLILSPLYLPESVLSRFTSIGDMSDTSTSYRVYIWMGTLAMLKDYWFCGIGPGSDAFNTIYPQYAYNAITAPHSHNLYLQIICDTGICGIVVFLLLLVAFYRMMFTAIRREGDRKMRIFQIAGVSAVSGFLVESMTDYTFYNYRVMLLFWLMLGLCVLFCRMGKPKTAEVADP